MKKNLTANLYNLSEKLDYKILNYIKYIELVDYSILSFDMILS